MRQGSIIGLLLFLIYVNDIYNSSNALQYILFADDTNAFCSNADFQILLRNINAELPKLSKWFRSNKLSLNLKKTNYIYFQDRKNNDIPDIEITLDGELLEKRDSTKFFGLLINENLRWNNHVQYISNTISRNIGILCKLKYYVPSNILFMLYNSLILPYISYCNIIWANSKSNVDTILLLQKKAMRLCTDSSYRDHTNPLFSKLKTLKVDDIYILQIALFMIRLQNGLLPSYFPHSLIWITPSTLTLQGKLKNSI